MQDKPVKLRLHEASQEALAREFDSEIRGIANKAKTISSGTRRAVTAPPLDACDYAPSAAQMSRREEQQNDADALRLLADWIATPETSRTVHSIEFDTARHVHIVEITAGGFIFRSETQRSLGGAIRGALQAAALG